MTSVDIRTPEGIGGSVELPAEIFDATASIPLIHQVVVAQLAAARSGNHKAKDRSEVAGGGRKPYRQKGTGRARQGSIRAPQFAGGGVVHGPTPRDYSQRTPKKMKAAALRGVLSDRAREDRIGVVSSFVAGDAPSTKEALAVLGDWRDEGRLLVVLSRDEESAWRSLRNVAAISLVSPDQLNAYDAVVSDRIVFTEAALAAFLGRGSADAATAEPAAADADKPAKKPAKKAPAKAEAKADADGQPEADEQSEAKATEKTEEES